MDIEKDLHVCENNVRLKPADHRLLRALAAARDIPPSVLARSLLLRGLREEQKRITGDDLNGRAA